MPGFADTGREMRRRDNGGRAGWRGVGRSLVVLACSGWSVGHLCAGPIRIAGTPVEIALSALSGRMIEVGILPLDERGQPKPRPHSTVLMPLQPVTAPVRVRELDGPREILLGDIKVAMRAGPLVILVTRNGKKVQELRIDESDGSILFQTPAPTFGLGEGRQQFDRRGFYYNFVNGQTDFLATHSATIPVPFLIGADGWGLFVHNPPPPPPAGTSGADLTKYNNIPWVVFDMRGGARGMQPARADQGGTVPPDPLPTTARVIPRRDGVGEAPVHLFVMALDTPAQAVEEYVRLTGKPVMPPKWALGYMQSHRSLAGPGEVLGIMQAFRDKRLPCDALIYLGTGYTNATRPNQVLGGWNNGHGSLEFNSAVFDQPEEMFRKIHGQGFKIILHKNAAPANLHGNSIEEVPADPDDPEHIRNYWNTHVPLVKAGVDGWWPDDGDQLPIEARLARHRLYHEGSLRDRPGVRPWTLNRNGYASAARHGAWIWSGDVESRWVTLANHIPVGLNQSMSLTPFWGSDTGGFFLPAAPEYTGELYARWFQFSAFTPLFRSHGRNWHLHLPWGWNLGTIPVRESGNSKAYPPESELHNAAVEPVCRKYLELRYRLLPYNYTITREACDTGLPLMRAHVLTDPDDPVAVNLGDQYLWGPSILVAPVVESGATSRRLYLPAGQWFDFWTGQAVPSQDPRAGRWLSRQVDLATMPLYVKAGAILPLDPVRQFTAQPVAEPTTLRVYPGASGSFLLYDDDGETQGYLTDEDERTQWIRLSYDDVSRKLTIAADPRMKVAAGFRRVFRVEMAGSPAVGGREVEFRGQALEVAF